MTRISRSLGGRFAVMLFGILIITPPPAFAAPPPEKTPDELKALVAAAFPPETKEFWKHAPELTELGEQVKTGLIEEDFVALERMAGEARAQAVPAADGRWKIVIFHEHILAPLDERLNSLDRRLEICKHWFAAKPDSIAARTALIRLQLQYAWQARGRGFVNSVTENGAKLFAERLEPIRKLVAEADWAKIDDPYFFAGAIEYAKVAGGTAEQVDACMRAAAKCKQPAAEPFVAGAEYFLPRWQTWSLADSKTIREVRVGGGPMQHAQPALSSDGRFFAGVFWGNATPVFRKLDEGENLAVDKLRLPQRIKGSALLPAFAAFTGDGGKVAFSYQATLYLANLESPQPFESHLSAPLAETWGAVCGVFTPDGKRLITGLAGHAIVSGAPLADGTPHFMAKPNSGAICIWNTDDLSLVRRLEGHEHQVYRVVLSPDGKRLVSAGSDQTLRIWNLEE